MHPTDGPELPTIQHLPAELQGYIISLLSAKLTRCYSTKIGDACGERAIDHHQHVHNTSTAYHVRLTHPSILALRFTNSYFRTLIPLSDTLPAEIERWPQDPWREYLACSVYLQFRPYNEFATGEAILRNADIFQRHNSKYRFCIDCGSLAYPHPHPDLPPRRQQRRLGTQPMALTTYAPGTKIHLSPNHLGYVSSPHVWVWCLDCRLLKTGKDAGEVGCRMFCKECCTRLGCRVVRHKNINRRQPTCRPPVILHREYGGIEEEIQKEKDRRDSRLNVGALYVTKGSSSLFGNHE